MANDPVRHEAAIAIALGLVYLALMPGHFQSIDGLLLYEQARSLWFDGSLRFAEPVVWGTAYPTSFYGIGGSLVHVPGIALLSFLEPSVHVPTGALQDWGRLYQDPVYALGGNPMQAIATAVAVYGAARMGAQLGLGPRSRMSAMGLLGIASPAFVYAGADFAQPLATALLTWAMVQALRFGRVARPHVLAACAVLVFFGVLVRPLETVLIAPFLVLAATPDLDLRRGAATASLLGLALAGAAVVSLAVNAARFGSPFHNEYAALGARFVLSWQGPLALLVSPAWGLLFAFPAVCVVPFGLAGSGGGRPEAVRRSAVIGFPVVLWLVIGCWHMWWGGISWGPRLLVPALPFLAVLAARGLDAFEPRVARRIAVVCFALGLLQALPGVLVDLHGGYGALVSVTSRGWWAIANPALGGWSGLDHLLAEGALDHHAVDVYWLRVARDTRFASLVVPVGLLAGAALIARRHLPAVFREPGFLIRTATWEADEAALSAVRFSVFVEEQKVPAEIEIDLLDDVCEHALAVDAQGRAIGVARLDASGHAGGAGHIGRVAVLPEWRGRGVGEALMRHMIERAARRGLRRIEISAQVQALAFYADLGFVAEGEVYVEAGIDHRHMRLDLDG